MTMQLIRSLMPPCIAAKLLLLAWPVFQAPAAAECSLNWRPGETPGFNGNVYATLAWDPDGTGPQPELLVVAGEFTSINGLVVNHIAAWTGIRWQALGGGMNDNVYALCVFNGDLIAGGVFTLADRSPADRLARWNGAAWESFTPQAFGGIIPSVHALLQFGSDLIIAGWFSFPGERIVRWDGASWQYMGNMGAAGGSTPHVVALATYQNKLIAGGFFDTAHGVTVNGVARWEGGTVWSPLHLGMGGSNPKVRALIAHNNDLIAGGDFTTAGGNNASRIAVWNGNHWWMMGSGFSGTMFVPWVSTLTIFNQDLIAGGGFVTSGGTTVNRIARWDGAAWQPLGSGLDDEVRTLTTFRNDLIVGGVFDAAGGDASAHDLARWGPDCSTGDLNCDRRVDTLDIPLFVSALIDPMGVDSCVRLLADVNFDGAPDGGDVHDFIGLILGS